MLRSTLAKRAWPLLLAAICFSYVYGLWRAPLMGADEPRYAEVAREMYARGDLITPTLGGRTWFEKPALMYWVGIVSFRVFGVGEWQVRLGAVGMGLLTVLCAVWLAGRVEARAGEELRGFKLTLCGLLATCTGLIAFSRAMNFDIAVTLAVTAALACFLNAEFAQDDRRRRWLLAGCYAALGLGLLAKGLVGIVIPAGVVGLYYLLRREWPKSWRTLAWGVPLALAVAALWFVPVYQRHGWTFVEQFFVQHHFARYLSNKYHHPQPFYFYPPVIVMLVLPWSAFLITALAGARHWRWRGDAPLDRLRVFALAWLVVPVAFFSLSGSKLPGYVLPALPAAALLAGERLHVYLRGRGDAWAMRATGAFVFLFGASLVAYDLYVRLIDLTCVTLLALPLACAGLFALLRPHARPECVWGIVAATLVVVVIASACVLPSAARGAAMRDLLRAADARGYAGAPVYSLHNAERTTEFYAAGRLAYDTRGEPLVFDWAGYVAEAARRQGGPVLVVVPREYVWQLTGFAQLTCEVIGDNGAFALVAARAQ